MTATAVDLNHLQAVNTKINANPFVPDSPIFDEAPDTWKFKPDGKGFLCRDYEGAKAVELVDEGWPALSLSCVLCYDELGDYHAVLAAETGGETWILDNRAAGIYEWDHPPFQYRWKLRQVAGTVGFLDITGA